MQNRPCAVLLAAEPDAGDLRVIVLTYMHMRLQDPESAVEIPPPTGQRPGFHDVQSWIARAEGHVFTWPGPDLRFGPESVALGLLPARAVQLVRNRILSLRRRNKARFLRRSE